MGQQYTLSQVKKLVGFQKYKVVLNLKALFHIKIFKTQWQSTDYTSQQG